MTDREKEDLAPCSPRSGSKLLSLPKLLKREKPSKSSLDDDKRSNSCSNASFHTEDDRLAELDILVELYHEEKEADVLIEEVQHEKSPVLEVISDGNVIPQLAIPILDTLSQQRQRRPSSEAEDVNDVRIRDEKTGENKAQNEGGMANTLVDSAQKVENISGKDGENSSEVSSHTTPVFGVNQDDCSDDSISSHGVNKDTGLAEATTFSGLSVGSGSGSRTPVFLSPHLSHRFFDRSLVEMKSQASSTSSVAYDSSDDIWVKRNDGERDAKKQADLLLPPSIIITEDDTRKMPTNSNEGGARPRAGTWSIPSKEKGGHLNVGLEGRHRRISGDDILTNSPSRKPAIFDAFRPRSKSDASKMKNPTHLLSSMKSAVHHSLSSPLGSKGPPQQMPATPPPGHTHLSPLDGLGSHQLQELKSRPRAGSESFKKPVSKVMEMFRHRSQSMTHSDKKPVQRPSVTHQNSTPQTGKIPAQQEVYDSNTSILLADPTTGALLRRHSLDPDRRRSASIAGTSSHSHRPPEALLDPNHAAILFRDARGLPVVDPFLEKVDIEDLEEDETQIFVKFFKFHRK